MEIARSQTGAPNRKAKPRCVCVYLRGEGSRNKRLSCLAQIENMSLENSEPLFALWIHTQRERHDLLQKFLPR